MISALAARHEIHVITSDPQGQLDSAVLDDIAASFTRVPWTQFPYPATRFGILTSLVRADPNVLVWLNRDRLEGLAAAIRDVAGQQHPDVVQITLGEIAPLLDAVDLPSALLLFDSLTREIEHRLAIETRPHRRARLRVERWRTERFERRWYARATGLASVSTVDAEWFERLLHRPVEVIENSIPDRLFERAQGERSATLVTFIGTLNHPPNTDAIEWLTTEIWPRVKVRRPDAELCVVGAGDRQGRTTAHLRTLVEGAGGRLDVDVDDIRPYYWDAAVVVAPVRTGAGMRTKVIHAMASSTPVVAHPTALEGLPIEASRYVTGGPTATAIAEAIVAVLDDPEAARSAAASASAAIAPLRAGAVAARLEAWWERVADDRASI
jgi:glycosyltransferase involved in cell wall biosynthesis